MEQPNPRLSRPPGPAPHGEAALLLTESLIHFLVERAFMTHAEALSVVQVASDAQAEIADERGDDAGLPIAGVTLLARIAASLAIDAL